MEGGRAMSLSFNITLQTEPTGQNEFDLEITENYEGINGMLLSLYDWPKIITNIGKLLG